MKKVTVCAMIAAMTVTGAAAIPVQAATNAGNSANCNGKGYYVFTGGKVSDLENIKSRLDELCGQLNGNTATITFPGCNLPENKPETTPPSEDTNTPESKPETTPPSEDANTPENKPEADKELTFAEQVVELVNQERTKAGLNAVTLDQNIASAALVRAKEIETSFPIPDRMEVNSAPLLQSRVLPSKVQERISHGDRNLRKRLCRHG